MECTNRDEYFCKGREKKGRSYKRLPKSQQAQIPIYLRLVFLQKHRTEGKKLYKLLHTTHEESFIFPTTPPDNHLLNNSFHIIRPFSSCMVIDLRTFSEMCLIPKHKVNTAHKSNICLFVCCFSYHPDSRLKGERTKRIPWATMHDHFFNTE